MEITRRGLLGTALAGAAASSFPLALTPRGKQPRQPKNIIFCVSDGMSMQTLAMTDQLLRMRDNKHSSWAEWLKRDDMVVGWQDTSSLNSLVTDSSAASSTWGSGRRIWNGQVNMYPDGTALRTLVSLMTEARVRCGLVTTTTITHATPAGFAVACRDRGLEGEIAKLYLESGADVLIGGGRRHFPEDLLNQYRQAGFAVVQNRDELKAFNGRKVLGLMSDSHTPYSVDWSNDAATEARVPTLSECVTTAIAALDGQSEGFLLQIEGGKVDHAAHANDVAGMLYDQIAFEDAAKTALEFAEKDGETLVIMTADHATGGPSLNGAGSGYGDSNAGLERVLNMKASYDRVRSAFGSSPSVSLVRDVVSNFLGIQLTEDEGKAVSDAAAGNHAYPTASFTRNVTSTLGMVLGNHSKITWTSGNHTSEFVPVLSFGPGSERIGHLTRNTDFFDIMLACKGLEHSNPTMTFEEAKRHRESKSSNLESGLSASIIDEGFGAL